MFEVTIRGAEPFAIVAVNVGAVAVPVKIGFATLDFKSKLSCRPVLYSGSALTRKILFAVSFE